MQVKKWLFTILLLPVYLCYGQGGRTIHGLVIDSVGPIPFASITETGKSNIVTADGKGNFTIVINSNSITVSATGHASKTVAVSSDSVTIILSREEVRLQEVVVTALGIRRTRNTIPYAAQQIAGEDVTRTRSNNFVQGLSGRIAGLDVKQTNTLGGSTNVVLRGTKSITGDNQALFVVDGIPYNNANTNTQNQRTGRGGYDYGNAAADINPDDIATITVLKGAAASALYGSQGANGVILITTKKGRSGLGITVNSSISVGMVDKKTLPTYQKSYGAGYGAFYEDSTGYFLYRDIDGDGQQDLVVPFLEDASYGAAFDPNLQVYHWDSFDATSPNYNMKHPWVAASHDPTTFFETALSSNQSIFLDGSSERQTFKLGYTRTDDKGILPNSHITKNLFTLGGTFNIAAKLTAGANVNFSNIKGTGRYGTGYDDKNVMTNFRQWWEMNVDIKDQRDAYFRTKKNVTWNWKDPDNLTPNFWDNPYFSRYENYENDNRNRYFGNINLNYKITNWLNLMGRVSQDNYAELQEERQAVGSVGVSSYTRFDRTYKENNYDLLATYNQDVSKDFNIKALLGGNVRRQHTTSIRSATNGGLIVPKIYAISNSLNTPNAPVEFDGIREVQGVFAGATVAWRDMLTLDGTVRRDRSSTLPKENNVYYYPSVSAGFVFSKLLHNNWLSYGKLRANYAEVGNDAPLFSVTDVYTVIPPFGSNPQSSVGGTKNNPDLLPERTRSSEAGLEVAFLKNRLGFDVTYYDAKSIDQILPVIVSTATGYNSKFLNAGTVQNKGVEVTMFLIPFQSKNFSWTINLNYARNRNKVLELFEGATNLILADFQGGVSLNATLGQPYGTIRGSNFVYTDNASSKGIMDKTVNQANGRYLLSPTSNEVIGNANPDWTGGISNSFKYRNATLSFLVDTRQGGDIFSLDLFYGFGTGLYPETVQPNDLGNPSRNTIADGGGIILPGVDPDGNPNTKRRANSEGTLGYRQPTAGFVYDASFIKLREVALTYSLPDKWLGDKKYFKGVDFTLAGRNLWIIHKNLPYADPEESISAGNLQGYQGGAYPSTRVITLNAKFRF